MENLTSLVDAEKNVQLFLVGALVGISDMASLCRIQGVSGWL